MAVSHLLSEGGFCCQPTENKEQVGPRYDIVLQSPKQELVCREYQTSKQGCCLELERDQGNLICQLSHSERSALTQIKKEEKMRIKSQTETEQLIFFLRKTPEDNLMLGLIKEFANLQNVSQLTACSPIPRAVGESIPWRILAMNLTIEEF